VRDIKVLQIISSNDTGGGGIHVLNLALYSKDIFHCIIGTLGEGELYKRSKSLKIDTVSFQKNSLYGKDILDYIVKNHIHIVNFHGANPFFLHCLLKNNIKIPTIATLHSDYRKDFLNNKIKYLFFTPLSFIGLKSFTNYICVSKYLKDLLEKNNFTGKKFIVSNGMDFQHTSISCSRENIREKYCISESDFVYVNVARMHPVKNQLSLIKAFSFLEKGRENVKLIIVGEGVMEEKLKREILKLKLQHKVILTGYRENSIDFINAGEVGILTSFNEGGAPPMVLLESAAVKKFFIAPDVGSIGDVIGRDLIYLVNPLSVEDIYEKMKSAYDKRREIALMGEILYNNTIDRFSMNNFCNQYLEAYNEILSGK
jgi:glycosyltransferase involved in cell wall biosynthesis